MAKVLIVEDDENIAKALKIRLGAAKHTVLSVSDALTGISAVNHEKPDIVLLDISLPNGNGFDVADNVKRTDDKQIPIIFLTATKDPMIVKKCGQYPNSVFFEKPYNAKALLKKVNELLGV